MEIKSIEYIFRIVLIIAVSLSFSYTVIRFIYGSIWDSIEGEIKKFTSFQYVTPLKLEQLKDEKRVKAGRTLNILLRIQYAFWILAFLGMIIIAIQGVIEN